MNSLLLPQPLRFCFFICFTCVGLLINQGLAQSLERKAVVSGGTIGTASGITLSISMGQPVSGTASLNQPMLTMGFQQPEQFIILGAEFLEMQLTLTPGQVELSWSGEMNEPIAHFVLEKKTHPSDDFFPIAQISFNHDSLLYTYPEPFFSKDRGTWFFRVKMIAQSGREYLSEVQQVQLPENRIWQVYPNPANEQITISWNAEQESKAFISLVNPQGKVVRTTTVQPTPGINFIPFDIKELPAGTYVLRLTEEGWVKTTLLTILPH
ncbi:MAG: T9SS type A sorting domain-containing protein [Bacteroidota bacterium]